MARQYQSELRAFYQQQLPFPEKTLGVNPSDCGPSCQILSRPTAFDEYNREGYPDFDELRAHLQWAALILRPYLRPIWHPQLREVYAQARQPQPIVLLRSSYIINALLPQAQVEEILRQE